MVDHQAGADRLAGLRGAAAARHHRHARLARDRERGLDVGGALRQDHARRLDLIDRGVGAVAPAIEGIEADLAFELAAECCRKLRRAAVAAEIAPDQSRPHREASALAAKSLQSIMIFPQRSPCAGAEAMHNAWARATARAARESRHDHETSKRAPFPSDPGPDQRPRPDPAGDRSRRSITAVPNSSARPADPGGHQAGVQDRGPGRIYPASGTGAWEAALVNTLSPGDRVLMVETGQFATLWREMARRLGLDVDCFPATGATASIRRWSSSARRDRGHRSRRSASSTTRPRPG